MLDGDWAAQEGCISETPVYLCCSRTRAFGPTAEVSRHALRHPSHNDSSEQEEHFNLMAGLFVAGDEEMRHLESSEVLPVW